MEKITLLIVDDHPMMRDALKIALEQEPDLHVLAEAADGITGVHLVAQLQPDVVLMDLLLPGLDGVSATAQILAAHPQTRILVISSLEDEAHILAAVQSGAMGYFPKSAPRAELIAAIRKVAAGVPYLPDALAAKLFNRLRAVTTLPDAPPNNADPLTARQQEVLRWLGEGRSDTEIARLLHITEGTVRAHLHNILQRLNLESRAQAVAYANRRSK